MTAEEHAKAAISSRLEDPQPDEASTPRPGGRGRTSTWSGSPCSRGLVGILLGLSNLAEDGGIDQAGVLGPLVAGVGSLVARFLVGRLVAKFGARRVTIASFLPTAKATVPFAFAFAGPDTSLWLLGAVLLVRGFRIGTVLVPPISVAYGDISPENIPDATMNTRISQQVGSSSGAAIVAIALQSALAGGATAAFQGPPSCLPGRRRLAGGGLRVQAP